MLGWYWRGRQIGAVVGPGIVPTGHLLDKFHWRGVYPPPRLVEAGWYLSDRKPMTELDRKALTRKFKDSLRAAGVRAVRNANGGKVFERIWRDRLRPFEPSEYNRRPRQRT